MVEGLGLKAYTPFQDWALAGDLPRFLLRICLVARGVTLLLSSEVGFQILRVLRTRV